MGKSDCIHMRQRCVCERTITYIKTFQFMNQLFTFVLLNDFNVSLETTATAEQNLSPRSPIPCTNYVTKMNHSTTVFLQIAF